MSELFIPSEPVSSLVRWETHNPQLGSWHFNERMCRKAELSPIMRAKSLMLQIQIRICYRSKGFWLANVLKILFSGGIISTGKNIVTLFKKKKIKKAA